MRIPDIFLADLEILNQTATARDYWMDLDMRASNQSFRTQRGATLVEYSLLVSLVAFVCVTGLTYLGRNVESKYSEIAFQLGGSSGNGGGGSRYSGGSGGGTESITNQNSRGNRDNGRGSR